MPFARQYLDALSIQPIPFNVLKGIEFDSCFKNSSSRALTLKGVVNGEVYSVKFFTSPSDALLRRYNKLSDYNLDFVPKYKVYENEICIVQGDRFVPQPVILGAWIDGVSLSEEVRRLCRNHDKESLRVLRDKMIDLFINLLSSEIIHGDLKFDNIIVGCDGKLSIIDWDAYYSHELKDDISLEVGTVYYQHPARTVNDYGKQVDDYSIALMVVSMIVYSEQPELYGCSLQHEGVLLSPEEVIERRCDLYAKMCEAWRYFPLRSELLRILASSDFHTPDLKRLLMRLRGKEQFDERTEMLIDSDLPVRRIVNRETKLYGYIGSDGCVIIDTMYGDCTLFGKDVAGVSINGRWFFVDHSGRQLSEAYQKIIAVGDGVFSVKKENEWFDILEKELKNL